MTGSPFVERIFIRQYGRRIEVSLQFCEQLAMPLHGETFLRYVLSRARASIRITRMRASRVRINSIIKREDFHAMATLGSASIRLSWICLHAYCYRR